MRFVSFIKYGRTAIGCLEPDEETLLDLTQAGLSDNLITLIEMGEQGLDMAREAAQKSRQILLQEVRLIAPFPTPRRNIICVGKNYFEHSKEFEKSGFDSTSGGQTIPDAPVIFTKATTSVTGPNEPIPASSDPSNSTDYEGELAVIVGKQGYRIPQSEAELHLRIHPNQRRNRPKSPATAQAVVPGEKFGRLLSDGADVCDR